MKFQKQGFGDATVGKVIFTVAFSQGRQATLQQKEKRTSIQEMMKDREAWHAAIHGVAESDYNLATKQQQLCSSVQSLSRVQLFATSWTAALQASLSITNSRSLLKLMSIESVMPSNHLILCHLLLFPPSIFPSIRVFSNESGNNREREYQYFWQTSSLNRYPHS